jgi:hypothetical protein
MLLNRGFGLRRPQQIEEDYEGKNQQQNEEQSWRHRYFL